MSHIVFHVANNRLASRLCIQLHTDVSRTSVFFFFFLRRFRSVIFFYFARSNALSPSGELVLSLALRAP